MINFRVELSSKNAAICRYQTLDLTTGTLTQELETFRNGDNMVCMVFTHKNRILRQSVEWIQKGMPCYNLSIHLNFLYQPTFVPLLNVDTKVIGYQLMPIAYGLDLHMLTALIGCFEITHRFFDARMLLVNRSRASREYNHIQLLYFLDRWDLILRWLRNLIEIPSLIIIERSKYVRSIKIPKPLNRAHSIRKNRYLFLQPRDLPEPKDLS